MKVELPNCTFHHKAKRILEYVIEDLLIVYVNTPLQLKPNSPNICHMRII